MQSMHIKLYFRINLIPGLEIDKAMTNESAVYILLGEILCLHLHMCKQPDCPGKRQ